MVHTKPDLRVFGNGSRWFGFVIADIIRLGSIGHQSLRNARHRKRFDGSGATREPFANHVIPGTDLLAGFPRIDCCRGTIPIPASTNRQRVHLVLRLYCDRLLACVRMPGNHVPHLGAFANKLLHLCCLRLLWVTLAINRPWDRSATMNRMGRNWLAIRLHLSVTPRSGVLESPAEWSQSKCKRRKPSA